MRDFLLNVVWNSALKDRNTHETWGCFTDHLTLRCTAIFRLNTSGERKNKRQPYMDKLGTRLVRLTWKHDTDTLMTIRNTVQQYNTDTTQEKYDITSRRRLHRR